MAPIDAHASIIACVSDSALAVAKTPPAALSAWVDRLPMMTQSVVDRAAQKAMRRACQFILFPIDAPLDIDDVV